MNELIYVLTVESLIFWLISTVLVSRRLDVFDWAQGSTWPVLGATVLANLAYAWVLIAICAVVIASKLRDVTAEICEAFARSSGRIACIQGLLVLYACIMVWLQPRSLWALTLCQLWDTSCNADKVGSTFWSMSYSVYMAALLPVLAVVAGIIMILSGICKTIPTQHARRGVLSNCVFVLILTVGHTVERNMQIGCDGGVAGCRVRDFPNDNTTLFNTSPGPVYVTSTPVLFAASGFFVSDLVVDILCGLLIIRGKSLALGLGVVVVRVTQLSTVPLLVFVLKLTLPWQLTWGHFAVASLLVLADIIQVLTFSLSHSNMDQDFDPEFDQKHLRDGNEFLTTDATFSLKPAVRRKFMLSQTRWPVTRSRTVPISKKRL